MQDWDTLRRRWCPRNLMPYRGTPYSLWTCPSVENPTNLGPSQLRITLLTMDLPHRGKPFSPWTFPALEHPTHHGPSPPRNTLLPQTCPTSEHPTHHGPAPPRNTLLTTDLPHRGTPYSPWTCPTWVMEHTTRSTNKELWKKKQEDDTTDDNTQHKDIVTYRLNGPMDPFSENSWKTMLILQKKDSPPSSVQKA